jgi:hypothetical protein
MVRKPGFAPGLSASQAEMLQLHHIRLSGHVQFPTLGYETVAASILNSQAAPL